MINFGCHLPKFYHEVSLKVYERALAFDEQNPDLYYNLGVVHIERGVPDQALYYFDKALELDADHVQALMNSAILMQETGRPEFRPTAYERLFKVRSRGCENASFSYRVSRQGRGSTCDPFNVTLTDF